MVRMEAKKASVVKPLNAGRNIAYYSCVYCSVCHPVFCDLDFLKKDHISASKQHPPNYCICHFKDLHLELSGKPCGLCWMFGRLKQLKYLLDQTEIPTMLISNVSGAEVLPKPLRLFLYSTSVSSHRFVRLWLQR